jgi:lysozyme
MMRRINAEGLAFIKQWEGLRLDAYKCSASVWTIGYGHTATAKQGMRISQTEAERLLYQDLAVFEAEVSRAVDVKLSDNQFAALVSWTYNVGVQAMRTSSLIRKLNQGDYASVPGELARWNKVGGTVNKGLSNRRAAEAGLWARGAFVASRDVEPTEPRRPSAASEAGALGGVAAAASAAAPAVTGLSGLHWAVGVALVAGVVALVAIWLLRRRDA